MHPRSAITDDNARSNIKVDGFGDASNKAPYLTLRFSILQHPPIVKSLCHCVIAAQRTVNEENIKIEHPCEAWHSPFH